MRYARQRCPSFAAFSPVALRYRSDSNCLRCCPENRTARRPRPPAFSFPRVVRIACSLDDTALNTDASSSLSRDEPEPIPPDPVPVQVPPKRSLSLETRRKISSTMLGVPKSAEMRAKLSASMKESMKNRPPWNKGKSLSLETRRRMSASRQGRTVWNKGKSMSESHKRAIAQARIASRVRVSDATRRLLQLARRRPGDGIVSGGAAPRRLSSEGGFPLVDTADIHEYVSLRRSLRGWSDSYAKRIGHRPTLADVRRTAQPSVIHGFERYVRMRGAIRGLAADVCGSVDPAAVPSVSSRDSTATSPQNNNLRRVHLTRHGNPRLASDQEAASVAGGQGSISFEEDGADAAALAVLGVSSTKNDQWDAYDAPPSLRPKRTSGFEIDHSLLGSHELDALSRPSKRDHLSVNDYRAIGKYRLLESKDICAFVQLRRDLENWSDKFKERNGYTPKLSDVENEATPGLYNKFCRYIDMRRSMEGLMKEVYGTNIDELENTYDRVSGEAQVALDLIRKASSN